MNDYKQKVLITIDTEAPIGTDPVSSMIYGKTSLGEEYGIRYLMNLFDSYNAKGLFFVDFAEAWDYGKDAIIDVAKCIIDCGHNVGVHIHPDHMADKDRRYLWQYSYDEQYEMISKCTELYEQELGTKPLSFRAGRYGANNDTITILDKLHYKYDMSEFYHNRYCKVDPPICANRVTNVKGTNLIEVPVTSFKSFTSPVYSRVDKIDCSNELNEFKRVMRRIYDTNSVDVVSFFVHSFSVLSWRKNPDNPLFSKKLNKRLVSQLEWINENADKYMFISESDLSEILPEDKNDELLDVSDGIIPYIFFIKRGMRVIKDRYTLNV